MTETMSAKSRQVLPALVCVLVILVAIAVVHPVGEIPMGDEITYVRSAQLLAQTGHIHYIGWINAMAGWQLYWGAAAIRIFGSSYLVLRWSMAAVAVATAFLLHRCFVRSDVRPVLAAAGTLTFCLSPLFLSKATTFLTDVPGVLAVVAGLYACLRTLEAKSRRAVIAWIAVATVGNSVLGSSRQIPWLGGLVMVPCVLWLLRRDRRVVVVGAGLWVVSLGLDCAMQIWFMRQPYTDREPSLLLGMTPHRMQLMGLEGFGTLLEIGMLLLPVLLVLLPMLLRGRLPAGSYVACALFSIGTLGLWRIHALAALEMPYIGESFRWPMGHGLKLMLTAVDLLGLLALLTMMLTRGDRVVTGTQVKSGISEDSLKVLLLPFVIVYLIALLPRAYNGGIWDRYLLLLMAPLMVLLLRLYQERIQWPGLVLGLALGVGAYATALMHDNFSHERARLAALNQLAARGVARTSVTGGWAYDIESELQIRPYVTPEGVRLPAGVKPPTSTHYGIENCQGFQCDLVPHVLPRYAVSTDARGVVPGFAGVPYRGWVTSSGTFYVVRFPQ